jgi:NAD(P)-dependent dehydrogenase (short-subunit alcohol dehydrogenase family)
MNAVSPGPVDTETFRSAGCDENAKNFLISRTPLGRIGTPSDIADAAARWLHLTLAGLLGK